MGVEFQDYYKTLGVDRKATDADIKSSYRKLARKLHPDVNKEEGAEDKFKQLNEAYEVLKDKENRKRYDTLGADWKNGQSFQPPPGWENIFNGQGGGGQASFGGGNVNGGGFSDFFNVLFGGQQAGGSPFGGGGFSQRGGFPHQGGMQTKGADYSAKLEVTLEEVVAKASKRVHFQSAKSYDIKIPAGIKDGQTIRLNGQGQESVYGGPNGDLLITINFKKHKDYKVDASKIKSTIKLTPSEAALGAKVEVKTLHGTVTLNIPAGTQGGSQFRLKSKGLPVAKKKEEFGDMLVKTLIAIPKDLSKEEQELFEKLKEVSSLKVR